MIASQFFLLTDQYFRASLSLIRKLYEGSFSLKGHLTTHFKEDFFLNGSLRCATSFSFETFWRLLGSDSKNTNNKRTHQSLFYRFLFQRMGKLIFDPFAHSKHHPGDPLPQPLSFDFLVLSTFCSPLSITQHDFLAELTVGSLRFTSGDWCYDSRTFNSVICIEHICSVSLSDSSNKFLFVGKRHAVSNNAIHLPYPVLASSSNPCIIEADAVVSRVWVSSFSSQLLVVMVDH